MKKQLLLFVVMLLPILTNAETVEKNGIYYKLDIKTKTATVTYGPNKYQGSINIPKRQVERTPGDTPGQFVTVTKCFYDSIYSENNLISWIELFSL